MQAGFLDDGHQSARNYLLNFDNHDSRSRRIIDSQQVARTRHSGSAARPMFPSEKQGVRTAGLTVRSASTIQP